MNGRLPGEENPRVELEESGFPPAKILIVDDTPANLFALRALLEPLGHEIVEAATGLEALALVTGDEFALILLDVMMPGLDGFETLAGLHAGGVAPQTPVVLLTAYDLDIRAIERAYALGAIDYLPKPTPPEVLRGKVAALVSLYRRGKELRNRGTALAAKDRHIAVLAHDLRNPLNTIVTAAHLLVKSSSDARAVGLAERISRAAGRMNAMVRDLLDYARAGTGAIPVTPVPMDLGELCRELVEEFELADPDRRIELEADGDLRGEWDRPRLHQALSNLVGNATRYGRGQAAIRVRRDRDRDAVEVSITNHGPAIPAELLSIIFEPFERGESDGAGLGLGLYIVREIARGHGGEVSVESSDERGTTFVLRLPRRPDTP
jgi:signal transduction histidine kinase